MSNEMILVRPPEPVTPSIARVFVEDATVKIFFPEKREDYDRIVKEYFRYGWQRPYRVRTFTEDTASDRAAEVVNHLLAGGFCVKADKALIDAAVAGEFEAEPRRWVKVFTSGDHDGWFAIGWVKDENLYHAAKRLPGARYDKPFVAVPPEQYEALLDFSEVHECHLYPSALALVKKARAEAEAAIVVDVATPLQKELPQPLDGRPPVLDVPESVEIDDDLADDD